RVADGREARHQGLELSWIGRPTPALTVQAQATFLDATTTRSVDPALVGKRTTNVPRVSTSLLSVWQVPTVPGLSWTNRLIWSGSKPVTRDNGVMLPSYWQLDTAFAWRQRSTQGSAVTWRVGIDNVFDRRYWRDAPTQYWGGIYLLPALPRTLRGSVTLSF
ncbi:MAG TPA: TonB-dependent receptor, partial [Quisquiliibacterium sp.]|nr:TonB-dependent receptor [Quisquiliibacterium sp.]